MTVLIIGSGISGLSAAIEAAELGCHVILASPYISERSQSVMAAGGTNAAINSSGDGDDYMCHARDTLKGGCHIENEGDVTGFCRMAPENLKWLDGMGVMFNKNADGIPVTRKFGGHSKCRTAYAGASTGKQIVTALVQKCREYEISGAVERRLGLNFYSALIRDGRCYGAVMCGEISGELTNIYADAVIMATGGQNKLFGKTTGSELCDGYSHGKLFTQGVKLKNLEFIQFHPTTIETDNKRMLISECVRAEGGRLFCLDNGRRVYFMEDKYGENGNLMPRDVVAKCIYDCPSQVYLDISFLDKKTISERLPEVYDICREYIGLDITKEPIPVAPSIHFFMGGFYVDNRHMTNIDMLYAVGECASKYHGANRLGGNSTMAAVYSGRIAARDIAVKPENPISDEIKAEFDAERDAEQNKLDTAKRTKSKFPAVYIESLLAQDMQKYAGITRTEETLKAGLTAVRYLSECVGSMHFDGDVSVYKNYRLYYMTILARAIIASAIERKETRGAHIRDDYPSQSDEYKKCSVAEYADGEIKISFIDESGKEVRREG